MLVQREPFDWVGGVHTPRLAAVEFFCEGELCNIRKSGMNTASKINFRSNEDTPLLAAGYLHYTIWQEHLFENLSVDELSKKAAEYRRNNM
jgi:hypothetical protein